MALTWGALAAFAVGTASATRAEQARDAVECFYNPSLSTRIHSCTRVLESAQLTSRQRADLHLRRGGAYAQRGENDRAIQDFDRAIALDTASAAAYLERARTYFEMKLYGKAIADFSRAVELAPDRADVYERRGHAHANSDQLERAVADYSKAIELKPQVYSPYNYRGILLAKLGRRDEAIRDFRAALRLIPTWDAQRYIIANRLRALGAEP